MLNKSLISRKPIVNIIKLSCSSVHNLNTKHSNVRSPEAIFLEKTAEVPIISVTEKENVDMIGPPDPLSNLRPIVRKRTLHETPLQQRLREMQDYTQEWNQKFWSEHNTKFIKERQLYMKSHKVSQEENRALTADEMSEFYKRFLDDNWKTHGLFGTIIAAFIAGPTSKQSYQSVPSYTRTKLRTLLPELAFNIKLFDEIGNNSKSILYDTGYGNLLLFETRYELFMTWKTVYTLQYTVPAYQYLSRSNDVYVLDMPLVDDVLPYALIKDSKTKVYLPTDSYLLMVNISEDHIKTSGREIVTTALAPSREVAVLYGMDLVNGMIPNFRLVYKRGTIHMFKPALYIIIYIQSIFLFYVFVSYLKPVVVLNKC